MMWNMDGGADLPMAITIDEARDALVAAHSEAADTEHFAGEPMEGGWCFYCVAPGDIPAGTTTWVVADNGAVRPLGLAESPECVLAQLNRQ